MIIHKELFLPSTSGGEWSGNTESIPSGMCHQVHVKSETSSTVFDITITDENDIDIREYTGVVGLLNDLTPFLARGVHTVSIQNATEDEDFKVLLCFKEK